MIPASTPRSAATAACQLTDHPSRSLGRRSSCLGRYPRSARYPPSTGPLRCSCQPDHFQQTGMTATAKLHHWSKTHQRTMRTMSSQMSRAGKASRQHTHRQTMLEVTPRRTKPARRRERRRNPSARGFRILRRRRRTRINRESEHPAGSTSPSQGAHRYVHSAFPRQGRRAVKRASFERSINVTPRSYQPWIQSPQSRDQSLQSRDQSLQSRDQSLQSSDEQQSSTF